MTQAKSTSEPLACGGNENNVPTVLVLDCAIIATIRMHMPEGGHTFEAPKPEDRKHLPEEGATRRQFLRQAGRFVGGALVAGSMAENIYRDTAPLREGQREAGNFAFSLLKLQEEIGEVKRQSPDRWEARIRERVQRGITTILKNEEENLRAPQRERHTRKGFKSGAIGGLGRELLRENLLKKNVEVEHPLLRAIIHLNDETRGVTQQVVNRMMNLAGTGAAIGYFLPTEGGPTETEGELLRQAEKMALDTLLVPPQEASENLDKMQQDLRAMIAKSTAQLSQYFVENFGLRGHLEQWGAGSVVTAFVVRNTLRQQSSMPPPASHDTDPRDP